MDTFRIDEIARRLLDSVPPAFRTVQQDLEGNFRAILRASLGKLDLVTRDEFDAQARVLERTRARLEALEARLAAMEGGAVAASPPSGQTHDAGVVAAASGQPLGPTPSDPNAAGKGLASGAEVAPGSPLAAPRH